MILRWLFGEDNMIRFGEWLLRSPLGPSLRWCVDRLRFTETWADQPSRRAANDGWGLCNTGADAPTVCKLGGIGCNVNHAAIRRRKRRAA